MSHIYAHIIPGILLTLLFLSPVSRAVGAAEKVFSGPQAGEKLTSLKVQGVFGDDAGKDFDYAQLAGDKPTVLIFMHKLTRPSAATERAIMNFCGKEKRSEFFAGVVYLSADLTAAEQRLKRARRALVPQANMYFGVSTDGAEGPGAYGLNRKMTLTVLVARKGKVTANFALVQPSVQADVLKILRQVVKITGEKMPKLADLGLRRYRRPTKRDPNIRAYLSPVIRKTATRTEVDQAVVRLEAYLKKNPATRIQIGDICRKIIHAGKLKNYGTKHCRKYMQKWAKEF